MKGITQTDTEKIDKKLKKIPMIKENEKRGGSTLMLTRQSTRQISFWSKLSPGYY